MIDVKCDLTATADVRVMNDKTYFEPALPDGSSAAMPETWMM
jgi:hypothetical protein